MLALQEDPWTYATGAGPAGGWGIGASSANPATSIFGPDATFTLSPLFGLLLISGGGRPNDRLAGGITIARMVELDQEDIKVVGPAARYSDEIRPGDILVRLNGAAMVSRRAAIGVNVKYSRTNRSYSELVYPDFDWWYSSYEGQLNVAAVDLGFRADGLLPKSSLLTRRGSMIPTSESRWPSGFTVGASINNLPLLHHGDVRHDDDAALWLGMGLAYRAVVSRAMCVSLNAAYYYWPGASRGAYLSDGELIPTKHAYSMGTGLEFNELLEMGFAVYGPARYARWDYHVYGLPHYFEQSGVDLEFYAGLGPPWLRFLASAGSYGGDGSYSSTDSNEFTGRFWVRVQVPFGEGQKMESTLFN
jgi:hypothetical protein